MLRGRWGEPLEDPANEYSPTYNYGVLRPNTLQSSLPTSPRLDQTGGRSWFRNLQGRGRGRGGARGHGGASGTGGASDRARSQQFRATVDAASAGARNPYGSGSGGATRAAASTSGAQNPYATGRAAAPGASASTLAGAGAGAGAGVAGVRAGVPTHMPGETVSRREQNARRQHELQRTNKEILAQFNDGEGPSSFGDWIQAFGHIVNAASDRAQDQR